MYPCSSGGYHWGKTSRLETDAAANNIHRYEKVIVLVQVPEGVESPHVQHGEQLSFGFGEGQTVTKRLEGRNHQSLLSVSHVQLHHRLSARRKRDR